MPATTGQLPAVVTILDLGNATLPLDSSVVFEAVQTSNGTMISVQVPLTAIMTTVQGALPTGGATGQILNKVNAGNYSTQWSGITQFVAVGTGLVTTGSATAIVMALNATAGTGIAISGATAVQIALASTAGLSVLGAAGNATAIPAPIVASASGQVLQVNAGGTGLLWTAVAGGQAPFNTTSLIQFGSLYGNGSAVIGATAAGTTAWPLVGNGTSLAPSFAVLTVPGGGIGTTTLTAHGVLLGEGTATLGIAVPSTAGNLLIDQGAAADPAFKPVAGDVTISVNGTTTIGANKVQFAQIQTVTGLSVVGVASTVTGNVGAITGAANQVLGVNAAGTSLGFRAFTSFLSAATITSYITPGVGTHTTAAGALYLLVELIGGGGGGAGSGTNAGNGTTGGITTFSTMTGSGGAFGRNDTIGGSGGGGAGGDVNLNGGTGQGGVAATSSQGGFGGVGFFGGQGIAGFASNPGNAASTNSGSGGGGAGSGATVNAGGGGGAGGYVRKVISAPAASYGFTVGAGGTAGVAGTSGSVGGAGGAGIIIVQTLFQ